jgi:hypothetical protein
MNSNPSINEQLAALGYRLLAGTARFQIAMSMGNVVYAKDQAGSLVAFSCEDGVVSASVSVQKELGKLPRAEFQVHRFTPVPKDSKTVLVRAFKIAGFVQWMEQEFDAEPSAACTLTCECGHSLSVNDAWASVYAPQPGGWLLVKQSGQAVYRSNEDFLKISVHKKDNFYEVPFLGDLALD